MVNIKRTNSKSPTKFKIHVFNNIQYTLNEIKQAFNHKRPVCSVYYSKETIQLIRSLQKINLIYGYLEKVDQNLVEVYLRVNKSCNTQPIQGIQLVSRPSHRVYTKYSKFTRILSRNPSKVIIVRSKKGVTSHASTTLIPRRFKGKKTYGGEFICTVV